MRKPHEIEEMIKQAIRDEIALYPLKSVSQLRAALYKYGYAAVHGPLDWHYVNKLTRKVRAENLAALFPKDRTERFAQLKERHRLITEKLGAILEGQTRSGFNKPLYPSDSERVAAANTILKWDLALFFAEEQIINLEKNEQKKSLSYPSIIEVTPVKSFSFHADVKRKGKTYSLGSRSKPTWGHASTGK